MEKKYYSDLEKSLARRQNVLLRTNKPDYSNDAVDVIRFLTSEKKLDVVLVSFGMFSESKLEELEHAGVDLKKIHFIHNLASDSFHDVDISINSLLGNLDISNTVVLFSHFHSLVEHKNPNEIGVFFGNFIHKMNSAGIPVINLLEREGDFVLLQTISSNSQKILSVRKVATVEQ